MNARDAAETGLLKLQNDLSEVPVKRDLLLGLSGILLPPLGVVLSVCVGGVQQMAEAIHKKRFERFRKFILEYKDGGDLDEGFLNNDEYLCYAYETCKAALELENEKKAKLFARLLLSRCSAISQEREFRFYLSVLKDVSNQELEILECLFKVESEVQDDVGMVEGILSYWPKFVSEMETRLSIEPNELPDVMTRLERTGLYHVLNGRVIGEPEGRGHLTATYAKFRSAIYSRAEGNK